MLRTLSIAALSTALSTLQPSRKRPALSVENNSWEGVRTFCSDVPIKEGTIVTIDPENKAKVLPAKVGSAGDPDADPIVPPTPASKAIGISLDCNLNGGKPRDPFGVGLFGKDATTRPAIVDPRSGPIEACDDLYLSNWYEDADGNAYFLQPDGTYLDIDGAPLDLTQCSGLSCCAGVSLARPDMDLSQTCLIAMAMCPAQKGMVETLPPSVKSIVASETTTLVQVEVDESNYGDGVTTIPLPPGCDKPVLVFLGGVLKRENRDYICQGGNIEVLNQPTWDPARDVPLILVCAQS